MVPVQGNDGGMVVEIIEVNKFALGWPIYRHWPMLKLDYIICHMVSRLTNLVMS